MKTIDREVNSTGNTQLHYDMAFNYLGSTISSENDMSVEYIP